MNIETDVDGTVSALHFIPITAEKVVIMNATVDMVLESTADDNVHWQLHDVTTMDFQDINITLTSSFLNKIAGWFKSSITKMIKSFLPQVSTLIDTQINNINSMVNNQTEFTWDFNLVSKNYPLNMTMTKAPEIAKDSHLISLNFDGSFHKQGDHLVPYTHEFFPKVTGTHREQLWIHENTLNTFISSAMEFYKNIELASPAMNKNLLMVLPELKEVCGGSCNFTFAINPRDTASMVSLTMAKGIVIGGPKTMFDVELFAMNETNGAPTSILTFETAMQMDVNFTMSNVVFYPVFKSSDFWNTTLTKSSVKMGSHKYDLVLDSVTTLMGQTYNQMHKAGIPIAVLDPDLAMIGGLIKNSTMTPYVADGWMYAGFSMAADAPCYHELYEHPTFEQAYIREQQTQFL